MIPDDFGGLQRNVVGGPLGRCSDKPLTAVFRDGCCNAGDENAEGIMSVCC